MGIIMTTLSLSLTPAFADDPDPNSTGAQMFNQLQAAGETGAGLSYQDPRDTAALIIRVCFGLLSTVFLGIIIYSGILWMTAGGNEEQVGKAKTWIFNSVIGLVIIFSAYSITIFAFRIVLGQTKTEGTTISGCSGLDCYE